MRVAIVENRLPGLVEMPRLPRTEKPLFLADLQPPRSLSPRGARNVVLCLAGFSLWLGVLFWSIGAWPVIGFMGADIALVSFAFYLSFRAARAGERIELRREILRVTRYSVKGKREFFDFQPYWLQVVLDRRGEDQCNLILRSHGKDFEIARFLGPQEKSDLAGRLQTGLRRCRARPGLAQ